MKPIRVLQIISGFAVEGPLGGIERFGIELAAALDKTAVMPIVCGMWAYDTPYEQAWVEHLRQQGIEAFMVADWQAAQPYAAFRAVNQALQQHIQQADIIHSHCQFGDVLALLHKRPLQAKGLVRTVHNEREWGKRPLRRLLLTNLLFPAAFDVEMGVAQQVVDNLDRRPVARLLKKKAVKSYNALNLERFAETAVDPYMVKQSLGIPAAATVIGTVGRLSEQKGYPDFLQAAQILLMQRSDLHFLIVGDGVQMTMLQALAADLGISQQVTFAGPRQDIESMLGVMAVFVNSSHWEGLPTVIMESMAARVPVVATAVGGNRELVQPEQTGWLVPPHAPTQLATAIEEVLDAPPTQRDRICQQAYDFVAHHFSIQTIARQHETLYRQLYQAKYR